MHSGNFLPQHLRKNTNRDGSRGHLTITACKITLIETAVEKSLLPSHTRQAQPLPNSSAAVSIRPSASHSATQQASTPRGTTSCTTASLPSPLQQQLVGRTLCSTFNTVYTTMIVQVQTWIANDCALRQHIWCAHIYTAPNVAGCPQPDSKGQRQHWHQLSVHTARQFCMVVHRLPAAQATSATYGCTRHVPSV